MKSKAKLIQPGIKLTAINPEKIARLNNADIIDLHDRLHDLYQLGKKLEDAEVCQRAEQAHRRYVFEMLQRSISHPYYDEMDKTVHVTEAHEDDEPEESQPDTHQDGIMLAFSIPQGIAHQIADDNGEPPEDMHMTLAYLGHIDDWDAEQLEQLPGIVSVYAANSKPMSGNIGGTGRFAASDSSNGQDVLYRSVDLPDLPSWRQGLIEWLEGAGFPQKSEHGYMPHITIKYLPSDELAEIGAQEQIPIEFGELMCQIGEKVYNFPLASLHMMKPNKWEDKLMASQEKLHESRGTIFNRKSSGTNILHDSGMGLHRDDGPSNVYSHNDTMLETEDGTDFAGISSGSDSPKGNQIIYGVLIVPDEADLDGTIFSQEVINRACAEYSNTIESDENHQDINNPGLDIADSFIAPENYEIDGHPVKPGSWIIGIRTNDEEVIRKVKNGDYKGLSIEGTASVEKRKMQESLA